MNQQQIGYFMKELRQQKQLTQEQLAQRLGVSNRSVSRWETGNNMPDIVLLLELCELYDIELSELLNGQRENIEMNQDTQETVLQMAEYDMVEKLKSNKKMNRFSLLGLLSMIGFMVMYTLDSTPIIDFLSGLLFGVSFGSILVSVIYTSKYGMDLCAFKQRILQKNK